MNSGPMASTIVSERIRSISTMAAELMCQPDRPASGCELVRSPRAPKSDHRSLSVEDPAQGKMDDAPSIFFLRKTVEPVQLPAGIAQTEEPGTSGHSFAGRPRQTASAPSCGQKAAPGTTGRRQVWQCFCPTIGKNGCFDGALEQIVRRLHRMHRRNLAKRIDLRGTEIADADHPNLAGAAAHPPSLPRFPRSARWGRANAPDRCR